MSSYSRIIKAHDVKLTHLPGEATNGFVRGIGNSPPADRGGEKARESREKASVDHAEAVRKEQMERKIATEKKAYDDLIANLERDRQHLSAASESVAKLLREVGSLREKLLAGAEKEILDLAFLIAGKVIHKEVDIDREIVLSVLRDAMRTMRGKDDVKIRMNPDDYRHITETNPDFLGSYGDITIERDETISRGGAIVETESGAVDARLDRQLDKVRDTLYDEHRF